MRRRVFLALIGAAATFRPLTVNAQQQTTPVIGFLHVASAASFAHLLVGLRQGLREAGYVEGQNLTIQYRWAEGDYNRLPALADDLVRSRVELIVTGGGQPA